MIWVWSLDNSVELALTNLDINESVRESVAFDGGDPLVGSTSTLLVVYLRLDIVDEEDGGDSNGSGDDFNDVDMEEDY